MATTPLLVLAGSQSGVVGRTQLTAQLGFSASTVGRMTASKLLVPMICGTYLLAGYDETFEARCMSALLWAGRNSFISSWSAARLHGLRKNNSDRVHVTVPVAATTTRSPKPWVELARSSWFDVDADSQTLAMGIRVATPERMLFGLAADVNQFRFDRAAEDAWHRQLTDPALMSDYLQRHRGRGRDGVARVEAFLERCGDRHLPAQSGFEQDVIDALERRLPPVVRQHRLSLANGEVVKLDIAWPEIRLAVEPGSSWFHGGDAGQARDHDRDLACNEVGWLVVRVDESFRRDLVGAADRVRRVYRRRVLDLVGAT